MRMCGVRSYRLVCALHYDCVFVKKKKSRPRRLVHISVDEYAQTMMARTTTQAHTISRGIRLRGRSNLSPSCDEF